VDDPLEQRIVTESNTAQDARYLFNMRYACRPADCQFDEHEESIHALRAVREFNAFLEAAGERKVK
jgi:hypothetical protein